MKAGNPRFLELLDLVRALHIAKSAGYGSDTDTWHNFRSASAWDIEPYRGALLRAGDKWARLQNLVRDPSKDQVGESVLDTALDLAAYMLIFICLWEEP
jgi:hypothetical protein